MSVFIILDRQPTQEELDASQSKAIEEVRQSLDESKWMICFEEGATLPQSLNGIQTYDLAGIKPIMQGAEWEAPVDMAEKARDAYQILGAKRKDFAATLINDFGADNNVLNINLEQTIHVTNKLKDVITFLQVGALETARHKLQEMQPDDFTQPEHFMTQAMIDNAVTKINEYLTDEGTWAPDLFS